jgi:hypothetical protein
MGMTPRTVCSAATRSTATSRSKPAISKYGKIGDQFGANYLIIETSGFYASGLAKLPIGDYIVPFAKIGGYIHDDDATLVNGAQVLATDTYSDTDFIFGGGLEFKLGSNFRMRAEYEKVNLPDSAFDIVSLSATYKF